MIVTHSVMLVTSPLRVILIHYEMMFRHAQSHRCVSQESIRLQEVRHNPRKYSPYPFLTNRYRSSSTILQLITETCMISSSFCSIHNTLVHQKITETHEIVSDSNEWRVLLVLLFHCELIIGLETIHIFNTFFDHVEKNRIRFREGNETSHFTFLLWATCLHRLFYWRSHSSRSRHIFCYFVSKCATLLH